MDGTVRERMRLWTVVDMTIINMFLFLFLLTVRFLSESIFYMQSPSNNGAAAEGGLCQGCGHNSMDC